MSSGGFGLRFLGFVAGCAAILSISCGGGSAAPAGVDVTGTWTGAATDAGGGVHPMALVVTQQGTNVTGAGSFDAKTISVTGTVSSKLWSGTFADGSNKFASYSLTVEGDAATGSGIAAADGGTATISLTRSSGGTGGAGTGGGAGSAGTSGGAGTGGVGAGGAGTGGNAGIAGTSGGAGTGGVGTGGAAAGASGAAGAPAADVILANVAAGDIALGGGYVYFVTETTIGRVPIVGGAVESVYTKFTTSGPRFIDADDTRIVWTEHAANTVFGAVRTCPISGCGTAPTDFPKKGESSNAISLDGDLVVWSCATLRSVLSTGVFGIGSPGLTLTDVVTEGGDVFWLDGGLLTTVGAVYKAPATASATAVKLSGAVGNPTKLSVHGDHVVVLSDTGVFQMGRDGGALTRLADGSSKYEVDVVTDGTRVYWAIGKNLYGCQLGSCTPTLVDTSTGLSAGLEIDATHLYWGTTTSIRRLDL